MKTTPPKKDWNSYSTEAAAEDVVEVLSMVYPRFHGRLGFDRVTGQTVKFKAGKTSNGFRVMFAVSGNPDKWELIQKWMVPEHVSNNKYEENEQ